MYKRIVKRFLDFIISAVALIVILPAFLIILILLTVLNRGKPFFFQERPGKNECIFNIIKFKTMTDKKDPKGNLLPDAQRITKVGNFVRKTSLDEIPQLLNVLKGDMSLIGPRPLRTYYLPLYNEEQKKRHDIRPGITGWAQVNGRNTISWTKKFEYDTFYVENCSLILDLKIIWMTVKKVVIREGVNQSQDQTMIPFDGKN